MSKWKCKDDLFVVTVLALVLQGIVFSLEWFCNYLVFQSWFALVLGFVWPMPFELKPPRPASGPSTHRDIQVRPGQ